MTLQASGALKLSQIRTELAQASSLNLGSTSARVLANKPSGAVKVSDFYGKTRSSVVLLAHMDGTNGSQSLVDSTGNYTFSVGAASSLNTATKKFGTASLYSPTSVTTLTTGRTDLASYTGDYTIEFWVHHVSGATGVSRFLSYGPYDASIRRAGTKYEVYDFGPSGPYLGVVFGTALMNQWVHIAKVRSAGVVRVYINGALGGSYGCSYAMSFAYFGIGEAASEYFNGYIDEFRVSLVAQYTNNFTPPAAPFA